MGYLDAPYTGLHNEPYPQPPPRPAERGWWSGLLDEFADIPGNIKTGLLATLKQQDPRERQRLLDEQLAAVQRGELDQNRPLVDLTGAGPVVAAVEGAEQGIKGDDPYGRGRGWGQFAKNLAMAVVPGSKIAQKAPSFETKAPKGGFRSGLSDTVYPVSVDDMTATRTPNAPMVSPKVITPEQLQGSLLVPAIGDRTIAGQTLTAINDKPLAFPVDLQGGPNFMRGPQQVADNAFWASTSGANTKMANRLKAQMEGGDPVSLVYTAMGERSGDFSHMMSDALLAQMPDAAITKTARRAFDVEMRKKNPDWPGIDAPNLREVLADNGDLRKAMAEKMDKAPWKAAGFPDTASTRAAITEPALLRETGAGASGLTVARVTDPRVVDAPTVPHATYPGQIAGGEYAGGFEQHVPRSLLWPDAYAQMKKEGLDPRTQYDRTFLMRMPVQRLDQKVLDGIMQYLNLKKAGQ